MDAKSLVKIIKACRDGGVATFKSKDVVIEFGLYEPLNQVSTAAQNQPGSQVPEEDVALQESIASLGKEQDLINEEEMSDDELLIVDPVSYEDNLGAGNYDDSISEPALYGEQEETA